MNENLENELKMLKESNEEVIINSFVEERLANGMIRERFINKISGDKLEWYFDKHGNIVILALDKNVVKAYECEISVSLYWNEIKVCYWKLVNN